VQAFSDAKLGLFIGDATGWNASALVERGLANAFWRARASEQLSPAQTLLDVNHLLVDYIAQGDHVTAFYAQVDLLSGAVTYSSAAHTGAYVLGRRGGLTMLITRGMPLGVGRELFTDRLEEGHVRLQEGESLLLLTDGVLKAENANGEPFGVERLEKCLRDRPGCDADAVVATIRDALHQFVGGDVLLDESAIVCLRLVNPLVLYPVRVVEPVGAGEAAEHS
jgi:sigma-B regulation protein RsbU (phosphoserine phosphatase)